MVASGKSIRRNEINDWGLYIHIPFCSRICTYCDFAKTARFDEAQVTQYFQLLQQQLMGWFSWLQDRHGRIPKIASVFLGGGTPGLFSHDYRALFELMRPHLLDGAEISLEANPENLSASNCAEWTRIGINRVSMGVQTFDPQGLIHLGRHHTPIEVQRSMDVLSKYFSNHNIDLIYGWKGQKKESWQKDLEIATTMNVPHLSLYNLIFESDTPLGRSVLRTGGEYHCDERLVEFYDIARETLHSQGYEHEEVSNWARPGFSCRHNWLYWSNQCYLAIGAGAHGHLQDAQGQHWRYSYTKHWQRFMRRAPDLNPLDQCSWDAEGGSFEIVPDADRFIDTIATGLRTNRGVDRSLLEDLSGQSFRPSLAWSQGVKDGKIYNIENRMYLRPDEWFREQFWAVELLRSFDPSK